MLCARRTCLFAALLFGISSCGLLVAQQDSSSSSSSSAPGATVRREAQTQRRAALIDPAGPQISLQTSEALFEIGAALNVCGYDAGQANSPPGRQKVRDALNAAIQASVQAQFTRDQLCAFIRSHRLSDSSHDLSQYVSLALYLTAPPELSNSVPLTEMPPDSTQVVEILPLIRKLAQQTDLHLIWLNVRPQYDAEVASLHDALTQMIVRTNAYLKTPASVSTQSRFAVVIEPLLNPGQTNARVYASDYVIVISPDRNGGVRMSDIRHTYLHYVLEPLLYSRASSMDRLLPFLKSVREAPLEYTFRSDIVSLVTECMIRAVEARTLDTGVAAYKAPAVVRHSEMEAVERERHATEQKAEAVRLTAVRHSMEEGYVLTSYFYERLAVFEKEPQSFQESIGEMVYGMDVPSELGRVKHVTFTQQSQGDLVRRSTRQLHGLDLAELKLLKGDVAGAGMLAQQALEQHTGDPARANFILARCAVLKSNVADARRYFEETIRLGQDPRLLAWSHIYLGRMDDLAHSREEAVAQYQQALVVRDGQIDTREAAERGLQAPYGPPPGARSATQADDDEGTDEAAPDEPSATRGPPTAAPALPPPAAAQPKPQP